MDVVRSRDDLEVSVDGVGSRGRAAWAAEPPTPRPPVRRSTVEQRTGGRTSEPVELGHLLERATWVAAEGVALVAGGTIRWANPALHAICAVAPGSLVGTGVTAIEVVPLGEEGVSGEPVDLHEGLDHPAVRRLQLRRRDGSTVAVSVTTDRIEAVPDGHWVLRVREIAAHIRVDEALRTSEARFRALADNAPIGVFLSDVGVRLAFVNRHMAHIWGAEPDELVGDRWLRAVVDGDADALLAALGGVLVGEDGEVTVGVRRPDGDVRIVDIRLVPVEGADRQTSFVGSVEDVTEARARESKLSWQARHDALTGLPNRVELWDRIHQHLEAGVAGVSLLFFDLDDFKLVNDSLGHAAGDELLTVVAARLADAVRPSDVVARFGGDEFVVLCPGLVREAPALALADRLLQTLRDPVPLGDRQIRVTASVGVLVADARERDAESLIRDADVAMYQAKSGGKARAAVFDAEARRLIEHRLDVVSDLRRAMSEGEVGVSYQPIVHQDGLRVVGAEALLRYSHRELGPLPANEVIEIAEASGCIDELGAYVLERACDDLVQWRERCEGFRPEYVSVNLAASQLSHPRFVEHVRAVLALHGLDPGSLCLELTESQLMTDVHRAEEVLGELAALGVRLAIDDFGTGYSSLAYLRRFPVSLVKIERSFVADSDDPFVVAIVEAVVSVTHALGGAVVAEGIETCEQLEALSDLGCSLFQGYLLARPGDAELLPVRPILAPAAVAVGEA